MTLCSSNRRKRLFARTLSDVSISSLLETIRTVARPQLRALSAFLIVSGTCWLSRG